MALLGAQFVFTLLMTSIMQKQLLTASIAKFFLVRGLFGYVPPGDDELRSAANLPNRANEKRKHQKSGKSGDADAGKDDSDEFTVPRTTRIALRRVPLAFFEPTQLPFFNDATSLMDFALYASVVFIATEFYYATARSAANEFNLSAVWCALTIFFALKLLLSLTKRVYLRSDNPGELGLCVSFAGVYLLIAMVALTDHRDSVFELRLDRSFAAFSNAAGKLIRKYLSDPNSDSSVDYPASSDGGFVDRRYVEASDEGDEADESALLNLQAFKGIVALLSAAFGACIIFPGMRFAKMYVDALADCEQLPRADELVDDASETEARKDPNAAPSPSPATTVRSTITSRLEQVMLHGVAFASLTVCLAYFRPLLDELRSSCDWLTDADIISVRLLLVLICSALRFAASRRLFQAHFELARRRVAALNREAGRISNAELRRSVARVVRYFGVVAAQLIAPALLAAFLALLVKTTCGATWIPPSLASRIPLFAPSNQTINAAALNATQDTGAAQLLAALHRVLPSSIGALLNATGFEPDIFDAARNHMSISIREVRELFGMQVLEGVLNYSLWWLHVSWFVSTVFGLIYYSYFAAAS